MRYFTMRWSNVLVPVMALAACVAALAQEPTYKLGRTPSDGEIRAWDIAISPDGKDLPPGSGTAKEGAKVYAQRCAKCHGPTGTEGLAAGNGKRFVGGKDTLTTIRPVKTIGSYWPFATMIWDYTNRAMSTNVGATLSADEVYAVTAWLLYRNGIIQESDVINAQSLPKVQMPNRNGFIPPRPDLKEYHTRCRAGYCP